MLRFAMLEGQGSNLEGPWFGNDTVWRTCLDLQRIVRYGRLDGTIGVTPMRQVISITDALVGGEGEGPMMPTPVLAGYLTGAINPAAAEWAHARLMGFDPRRIPLLLAAFSNFSYPLTDFPPSEVVTLQGFASGRRRNLSRRRSCFHTGKGVEGHCELNATRNNLALRSPIVA